MFTNVAYNSIIFYCKKLYAPMATPIFLAKPRLSRGSLCVLFAIKLLSDKDKIRSEAPQKFLGTASLLCQVYARMLNDKGEPFVPLNNSVMDCLSMMLDDKATDEEMLCGAEQVRWHWYHTLPSVNMGPPYLTHNKSYYTPRS